MRTMELADRHGFPLVTLVDTPGAYPGVAAEQHGQGGAIARSQAAMVRLGVPTVACRHRRGRLGRCDRDRGRRPRAHAGERDLLGDLARRAARRSSGATRREAKKAAAAFKPDAAHCLELRRDRRDRRRSPRGARRSTTTRLPRSSEQGCSPHLEELSRPDPPTSAGEPRRAKYRVDGRPGARLTGVSGISTLSTGLSPDGNPGFAADSSDLQRRC